MQTNMNNLHRVTCSKAAASSKREMSRSRQTPHLFEREKKEKKSNNEA